MTIPDGDSNHSPLTSATPHNEGMLVRHDQTIELYLPLTSTVVLKRKQEMLYVPLDFDNDLTIDALEDSGVYVSAIAQNDFATKKRPRTTSSKVTTIPIFNYK